MAEQSLPPNPAENPETAARHAATLRAFLNAELDPSVDARQLFDITLNEPLAEALLRPEGTERRNENNEATVAENPVVSALEDFRALSEQKQQALFLAHQEKRQRYLKQKADEEQKQKTLEQNRTRVEHLRAYLEGTLPAEVDIAPDLELNLLDFWKQEEERRKSEAEKARNQPQTTGEQSSESSPEHAAHAIASELAELLTRYAALSPSDKLELAKKHSASREAHQKKQSEQTTEESVARDAAENAALQRKAALLAAKEASTEMARVIAEEKARLLGVREEQAKRIEKVAKARKETLQSREEAFAWDRKVRKLLMTSSFEMGREERAATLYEDLVQSLTVKRRDLRSALRIAATPPKVPGPDPLAEIPDIPERKELDVLSAELRAEEKRLEEELRRWRLERAEILRACVVDENKARLSLLPLLSPSLRSEKLGFSAAGIAQATREVAQIELEARFHWLQLRYGMSGTVQRLSAQPLLLLLVTVKLAMITFLFRLWRRKAHPLLNEVIAWGTSRGAGPGGELAATLAWYLDRTRQPLEWLLYLSTLVSVLRQLGDVPESRYLAEIIMWLCIGGFATRLIDALASRQTKEDERARLRYSSLRLVGLNAVSVILLMRLARLSVGTGTLYSWIGTASWILILPIAALLLSWWRPTVLLLAREHHEPTALLKWAATRKQGPASYVATALAGGQLFYEGSYRFFLQRAAHLQATQRLLAYLFRRELEKRSSGEEDAYEPLSQALVERFEDAVRKHQLIESYAKKELDVLSTIAEGETNTVVALVGERGLGKSFFIERAVAQLDEGDALGIACQPGGYGRMLAALRLQLQLPSDCPKGEVIEALKQRAPKMIWVDDAHFLIRPLIGGLKDFDQLAELAHEVGGRTCWLIAVRAPAWNYLKRARGDRAVVDSVIGLPRWTESQILTLTRNCAAAANLDPRYDDLVVPRQIDVSSYGSGTEHTERDYGRILWDYSDGNPTVALHFFLNSLRIRHEQPHVRLFTPPSASNLEELPTSIYFVLRSVIQLGAAAEADIVRCTGLSASDVADALRLAKSRGYVESQGKRFSVTIQWYRAITQLLRRQHLLIG